MKTKLTKVKRLVTDEIPIGYYHVAFEAIWGWSCVDEPHNSCEQAGCIEGEPNHIAEVDSEVTKVTKENYTTLAGIEGMTLETNTGDKYDDTHDLRPRLFKTKAEAEKHRKYTLNRFKNPQPWESFVKYA